MVIKVNGKNVELEKEISIMEYVLLKNLKPDTIVIEHNLEIVKKEDWENIILKEDDTLEVLRFVGGG